MKNIIFGIFAFAFAAPVFAKSPAQGLSAEDAEALVVREAHHWLKHDAPDFGGDVHSPCLANLQGDLYTVSCKGVADETVGGGGFVKSDFTAVGTFVEGHDGLFYQEGSVHFTN